MPQIDFFVHFSNPMPHHQQQPPLTCLSVGAVLILFVVVVLWAILPTFKRARSPPVVYAIGVAKLVFVFGRFHVVLLFIVVS